MTRGRRIHANWSVVQAAKSRNRTDTRVSSWSGEGEITLLNVKPSVGFTLPSAGVTPALSEKTRAGVTPAPTVKAARRWRARPLPTAQYCAAVAMAMRPDGRLEQVQGEQSRKESDTPTGARDQGIERGMKCCGVAARGGCSTGVGGIGAILSVSLGRV